MCVRSGGTRVRGGRGGDVREGWAGLKAGARSGSLWATSPVTRAGYQRPSCCLARHAEPACRELRSGSWKGRSSATGTTCPWENLWSGQGGAQTRSARASEPRTTRSACLGITLQGGVLGRQTHRRAHTHTLHVCRYAHTSTHTHTCTCPYTCAQPRAQTCAHPCAPVYTWPHTLAHALAPGKDMATPRTRCLVLLPGFLGEGRSAGRSLC